MEEGPFAIFRLMKHHAPVVTPMEAHHERMKESYKSNKQIDPERTPLNYHVIEPQGRYRQIANQQVRGGVPYPKGQCADYGGAHYGEP